MLGAMQAGCMYSTAQGVRNGDATQMSLAGGGGGGGGRLVPGKEGICQGVKYPLGTGLWGRPE